MQANTGYHFAMGRVSSRLIQKLAVNASDELIQYRP